jgi:dolichol kinase
VNGAMKAAWGLTVFVIVVGAVLWATTGRTVFAIFIVLGVLTGIGAWLTGRSLPASPTRKEQKP